MRLGAHYVTETFDPADETVSPGLRDLLAKEEPRLRAVLLVAGQDARRNGWAARSAARLAGAWAEAGERIILADLSFQDPELHRIFGVPNAEGVADTFLFGASVQRIAQPLDHSSLRFLPAGPYAPDSGEILHDPRWDRLIARLAQDGATVCLYVPAESPGLSAIAGRVRHAVVLAAAADMERVARVLPAATVLQATLTPSARVDLYRAAEEDTPPGDVVAAPSPVAAPVAPTPPRPAEPAGGPPDPDRAAVAEAVDAWIASLGPEAAAGDDVGASVAAAVSQPAGDGQPNVALIEETLSPWTMRILIVVLAVAFIVAVWLGIRLLRGPAGEPEETVPSVSTVEAPAPLRSPLDAITRVAGPGPDVPGQAGSPDDWRATAPRAGSVETTPTFEGRSFRTAS